MAKYRISEIFVARYNKDATDVIYIPKFIVEKRVFGFLWWYNLFDDEYSSGEFETLEKAEAALKRWNSRYCIAKTIVSEF